MFLEKCGQWKRVMSWKPEDKIFQEGESAFKKIKVQILSDKPL